MAYISTKGNFSVSTGDVVYHTGDKKFYTLYEYWEGGSLVIGAVPFTTSNNVGETNIAAVHTYYHNNVEDQLVYVGEHDELIKFWKECAINAMQGFQESGGKVGMAADFLQSETAKLSFKMADAMLREYMERLVE